MRWGILRSAGNTPVRNYVTISLAPPGTEGKLILVTSVYGHRHSRGDGRTTQSTDKGGASTRHMIATISLVMF